MDEVVEPEQPEIVVPPQPPTADTQLISANEQLGQTAPIANDSILSGNDVDIQGTDGDQIETNSLLQE